MVDRARPFTRWAGGKAQLLPELRKHIPRSYETYFEPFVGGGALFFGLAPASAVLCDVNEDLATTYMALRDDVDGVVAELTRHAEAYAKDGADWYYLVRREMGPATPIVTAARTIFLLKAGFNGVWRVNGDGRYNVPAGKFKTAPTICEPELLRAVSSALQRASVRHGDFTDGAWDADAGDLVYFDPPYWPASLTSDFTQYAKAGFGQKDQERLAGFARLLKDRGAHVVLSNADVPGVRELYADGFTLHEVQARRSVNSDTAKRGKVGELIIVGGAS